MNISVIIATKNRPEKILHTIQSLLATKFSSYEIIIVDQSNNNQTYNAVQTVKNHTNITYIRTAQKGLGFARNQGLRHAKFSIISFTDDDCIVQLNWLQNISDCFTRHATVSGVFGEVLPYKPYQHRGMICPSIFIKKKTVYTHDPHIIHYKSLGLGNNMSFRKSALLKIGGFKPWLGAGSIGKSAEESDLIFRLLCAKHSLLYDPNIVLYHDRWLSKTTERLLQSEYTRGLFAFYAYYFFSANGQATWPMMKHRFFERFRPAIQTILHDKYTIRDRSIDIYVTFHEILNALYGLFIGIFFQLKDLYL